MSKNLDICHFANGRTLRADFKQKMRPTDFYAHLGQKVYEKTGRVYKSDLLSLSEYRNNLEKEYNKHYPSGGPKNAPMSMSASPKPKSQTHERRDWESDKEYRERTGIDTRSLWERVFDWGLFHR